MRVKWSTAMKPYKGCAVTHVLLGQVPKCDPFMHTSVRMIDPCRPTIHVYRSLAGIPEDTPSFPPPWVAQLPIHPSWVVAVHLGCRG